MQCGICTENFDATERVPKVLPCGHTACLQCLLLPDCKCPTCRQDFNGPPPELPTNFAVLQLLEGVRQESTPRHAEDPVKKILRLLLAAALTEDRAADPDSPPAAGSPPTAVRPPPAAEALLQPEMDVAAITDSEPDAHQQEKAAALRDAPGLLEIVVLSAALAAVLAQQQPQVTITKYSFTPNTGNGEYSFEYELSDGSVRSEQGVLQNAGTENEFLLVTGSFRWTSPEGQVTQVDYTADDTGYHPNKVQGVRGFGGGGGGGVVEAGLSASLIG